MEMTSEQVESRNKALIFTIMFVLLMLVLTLTGCASLRQGEGRDVECRVLGLDASVPIPFAKGVNIMNVRLGWVETRYTHTYKVKFVSDAKDKVSYLGEASRKVTMENSKSK